MNIPIKLLYETLHSANTDEKILSVSFAKKIISICLKAGCWDTKKIEYQHYEQIQNKYYDENSKIVGYQPIHSVLCGLFSKLFDLLYKSNSNSDLFYDTFQELCRCSNRSHLEWQRYSYMVGR